MNISLARLAGAISATIALGAPALLIAPAQVAASSSFEIGRTPFYGPVPTLDEHSRVAFWYGLLDQAKVDQLKAYDLVVLEPTLRVLNVEQDHFYFESVTSTQVQEIKRGLDGVLGTGDDAIVLGYVSVGEMLSTIIPGSSGHMTISQGIDLGLLPENYSGPSGPLHGPNPWNFNTAGQYVDIEGGATPDGTYDDGYDGYAELSIAPDYSSWGDRLTWRNQGLMPWYLDQQGTWVTDERYIYGGYWQDGDGAVDINNNFGGGYTNGGDPAWQRFITYRVDKIVHDGEYDGVFLDTVDTPDPAGGAGPSISWGPRGNFGFTAEGMVELVEQVKAVDPTKVVAANRAYWYLNPDEGTSQFAGRYRDAINIFVTESWYYNPFIPGFYDESPGFEDNWNTDPSSPTYRNRDNFGGFWKDFMNAHAAHTSGFNIVIIDFQVPANRLDKWMNEVVVGSGYLGYDVAGAQHFNSAIYDDAKNWLDNQGLAAPGQAGAHPTDLYGGFVVDGEFSEWAGEAPIFSDPAGGNGKGITAVYARFVDDRFFLMVEANQTLNLSQEQILFDYDQNGPSGWQVFWPTTPDSRIYVENLNQTYLLPHAGPGQGDVFRFSSPNSPSNRGWPVRLIQAGNRAELEFDRDYIFPDEMAGNEVWTWFRVANFGGEPVSFTVPQAGPVISDIQVTGIDDTSATITWTTDRPADSVVEYGTTTSYGSTTTSAAGVTSHTVTLTDLDPGTTYHFRVSSTDADGLTSTSGDRTFTTTTTTVPPVISDVQVTGIGITEATITWSTNVPASSLVEYGVTTAYGSTETGPGGTTSHAVTLTGLEPGTTYHFRVQSTAPGGTATSGDHTFTTGDEPPFPEITIDGAAGDWAGISPLMTGGTSVQSVSVTNDESTLYLLVQGSGLDVFGQFYLNTDNNPGTGYAATGWSHPSGADFLLENNNLYVHTGGGWSWSLVGQVDFARNSTTVETATPLTTLGLQPGDQLTLGYLKNNSPTDRLPSPNDPFPVATLLEGQ